MKTKNIKQFYFDHAQYIVGDGNGNKIVLKLNYKDGSYSFDLPRASNESVEILKNEAKKIAEDLLNRKTKVNFASAS